MLTSFLDTTGISLFCPPLHLPTPLPLLGLLFCFMKNQFTVKKKKIQTVSVVFIVNVWEREPYYHSSTCDVADWTKDLVFESPTLYVLYSLPGPNSINGLRGFWKVWNIDSEVDKLNGFKVFQRDPFWKNEAGGKYWLFFLFLFLFLLHEKAQMCEARSSGSLCYFLPKNPLYFFLTVFRRSFQLGLSTKLPLWSFRCCSDMSRDEETET